MSSSKYRLISIVLIFIITSLLLPEYSESSMKLRWYQTQQKDKKTLLLLFDGFRWDYLEPDLEGFKEIQRIGCRAKYSKPVFPSLSYPNYYTIATGLFVENHGITHNQMYNPETKQEFDSNPMWWNQTEPLWISTTKAKMVTDMYHWPGVNVLTRNHAITLTAKAFADFQPALADSISARAGIYRCHVTIRGFEPNYCIPSSHEISEFAQDLEGHLDAVVGKFARNESRVALVYSEQPDLIGHKAGPNSKRVDEELRRLDKIMLRFIHKLRLHGLQNKVNVLIMSDHGITPVDTWSVDRLPMADYVDVAVIDKIIFRGAVVGIFPKDGKVDEVVESLKFMPKTRVWKKEDIPEEFHYKNNVNTPPVLLLANPGMVILKLDDPGMSISPHGSYSSFVADLEYDGAHGYDPNTFSDMRGIFMAFGPDFRKNYRGPAIGNEDVYNLAMVLIGLTPHPNNGTWAKVVPFLAHKTLKKERTKKHSTS